MSKASMIASRTEECSGSGGWIAEITRRRQGYPSYHSLLESIEGDRAA